MAVIKINTEYIHGLEDKNVHIGFKKQGLVTS